MSYGTRIAKINKIKKIVGKINKIIKVSIAEQNHQKSIATPEYQ